MAEIEVTREDIDSLTAKLEGLDLSESERAVLAALLAHGASGVRREPGVSADPGPHRSTVSHSDALPPIAEQLAAAFTPSAPPDTQQAVFISVGGGN